jgi:hypothetical protein
MQPLPHFQERFSLRGPCWHGRASSP